MHRPNPTTHQRQPPEPRDGRGSGGDPPASEAEEYRPACGREATDALWQYLRRIEESLDQIDARIDRLYVALGGGTMLLAAIGLVSAFIVRGG